MNNMSRTIFMLMAIMAIAMAPSVIAVDCAAGLKSVTASGAANGFKSCAAAAGAAKIDGACCAKLVPFISYASCLSDPAYSGQAASFLAPVSVSKAKMDCLGSR
ncbi:MAG: hypothetical protein WDW38_001804 [Sanguina aurantia]